MHAAYSTVGSRTNARRPPWQVNGLFDLLVPGGGFGQFAGCENIFPQVSLPIPH